MNKLMKRLIIVVFATIMVVFVNHRERSVPYDLTPPSLYDLKYEKKLDRVTVRISFKDDSANQPKSIVLQHNNQSYVMNRVTSEFVSSYSTYSIEIPLSENNSSFIIVASDINDNISSYEFEID